MTCRLLAALRARAADVLEKTERLRVREIWLGDGSGMGNKIELWQRPKGSESSRGSVTSLPCARLASLALTFLVAFMSGHAAGEAAPPAASEVITRVNRAATHADYVALRADMLQEFAGASAAMRAPSRHRRMEAAAGESAAARQDNQGEVRVPQGQDRRMPAGAGTSFRAGLSQRPAADGRWRPSSEATAGRKYGVQSRRLQLRPIRKETLWNCIAARLLDHVHLRARDLEASKRFYRKHCRRWARRRASCESADHFSADELWIDRAEGATSNVHLAFQAPGPGSGAPFPMPARAEGRRARQWRAGERKYHPGVLRGVRSRPRRKQRRSRLSWSDGGVAESILITPTR
jgi:hypothetical protein